MRPNPQEKDPVYLMGQRLLMLLGIGIFILAASGVWGVYQKQRESALLRDQAENNLAGYQRRYDQLDADITRLKTERGKEAVLREQYDLGKEGEKLIIIVDPSTSTTTKATSTRFEWIKKAFGWW